MTDKKSTTGPTIEYVAHTTAIRKEFIGAGWDKNNAEHMIIAMLQLQAAETLKGTERK